MDIDVQNKKVHSVSTLPTKTIDETVELFRNKLLEIQSHLPYPMTGITTMCAIGWGLPIVD